MQPMPAALPTHIALPDWAGDLMALLLVCGMLLLMGSLHLIHKLAGELPGGSNRNWWRLLSGLIVLFIAGYATFLYLKAGRQYTGSDIVVPFIFFFGAVFVQLVCLLSYRTTLSLKRVFSLEQESITDPMLGIFNRRYLDRRLQEEVLRSQRHRLDLCLLLIDVDHFKKVNDTWGHQIGDLALKQLAAVLLRELRQTDIIARYGGEEFVILLPHTTAAEALPLAERLRKLVERSPLQLTVEDRPTTIALTISIGSSRLLPEGDSAFALLERADKALYQAKQEGRNRIGCIDRPPTTELAGAAR